jgi:hypothetical protein
MKKTKIPAALWFVALPALVLLLLMMLFTRPTLELEMDTFFRPEDDARTLLGFQVEIVDNALVSSNYTVKKAEGLYTAVFMQAGGETMVVSDREMTTSTDSALTLKQAKALIEPVWNVMMDELRGGNAVSIMITSPKGVNDSLLVRRKTNMTLSVSTGTITPVEDYLGTTDYGMIYARIYDKNLTASAEKYIMLIP